MEEAKMVTPGEVLGRATELKAGKGAYMARLTTKPSMLPSPASAASRPLLTKRPTVEVTGHRADGPVPEPGSVVIARVTKVMARTTSAETMCVGPKPVREKFTGTFSSFVKLPLGDGRAYYLSTAKNELGVVSAESSAGGAMVPICWDRNVMPIDWPN